MSAKIDLRKLFSVAVVLKVFFAGISLVLASPYVCGLAFPLAVMGLYIWLGATRRDPIVSDEKFADSCYYLGFIFTIASIIASLFDLQNIGSGLSDVAARFGAAMVSTCLGVIVRVILVSFRPDTEDVIRSAEDLVLTSYRRLSDEFSRSFDQLVVFRGEAVEASRVAVSSVKEQVDSMAEMQRQQTETFFKEMTEYNKATILSLIQDISTASSGLNWILRQYQAKASETCQGIDQNINTLVERLNAVEFPQDIFSSRLAAPIAQLNGTTTDATASVMQVSENVKSAAKSVSSSVQMINTKAESISEVLSVVQTISTEQQEVISAIKRQQQLFFDQLQVYQDGMLKAMSAQQGAMLGEMREHSEMIVGANTVMSRTFMSRLADSIGENREVADDFRNACLNITHVAGEMGNVVKGAMESLAPVIISLEDMAKQSASEARASTASIESLSDLMVQLIELNKHQTNQVENTSRQLQGIADINGQMLALNENITQMVLSSSKPVVKNYEDAEGFVNAGKVSAHGTESQSLITTG